MLGSVIALPWRGEPSTDSGVVAPKLDRGRYATFSMSSSGWLVLSLSYIGRITLCQNVVSRQNGRPIRRLRQPNLAADFRTEAAHLLAHRQEAEHGRLAVPMAAEPSSPTAREP